VSGATLEIKIDACSLMLCELASVPALDVGRSESE